jgi:uncharacterized membrane protein
LPHRLAPTGRIFYAVGLIGIQHLIFADFIPVIVPSWPSWIPGRLLWAYAAGAAPIAVGAAIISGSRREPVAAVAGAAILVLVVIDEVPGRLAAHPAHLRVWTNTCKVPTMCVRCLVVAGSVVERPSKITGHLETIMPVGRFFFAFPVAVFGMDHFVYIDFVAGLVPSWIGGAVWWQL